MRSIRGMTSIDGALERALQNQVNQANAHGVMGAGLALQLKNKLPRCSPNTNAVAQLASSAPAR
jgi:hypothetical protein